jgi:rhamnulokinase
LQSSVVPNSTLAGTPVIAPAAHDTGSAVAAIAASDGTAFLSSGTWSLIGCELDAPVITPLAMQLNFTNEGGVCGTTRLLKNVMGLWLLQSCQRAWGARDYSELIQSAEREKSFCSLVNPDHESFLRPGDTRAAIDKFCSATEQPSPASAAAYVRVILESLAFKYRLVLGSLEKLIGRRIDQIRVIGGGSRNKLLNQLTADATGRKVLAGPTEATALGNAAVQILATSEATSLKEVRAMIERSFRIEVFEPVNTDHWDRHAARFEQYCEVAHA